MQPRLNGLDALRQLKNDNPRLKFVVLTMYQEPAIARHAFQSGASAFVLKACAPDELIPAIHTALNNTSYITPSLRDVTEFV